MGPITRFARPTAAGHELRKLLPDDGSKDFQRNLSISSTPAAIGAAQARPAERKDEEVRDVLGIGAAVVGEVPEVAFGLGSVVPAWGDWRSPKRP